MSSEKKKNLMTDTVEQLVRIVDQLETLNAAVWDVAIELAQINERMEKLTGEDGALQVAIDYEKLGDQIAAALGQIVVEASIPAKAEFPSSKGK